MPGGAQAPTIAPKPGDNQVDAAGKVSSQSLASDIWSSHKNGLLARRPLDLKCEELLMHVDGAGDLQWAVIMKDSRVEVPPGVSEFRKTENILRLIVDNAVAQHTTMPLNYFADSSPDRQARDKAIVDTVWINDLSYRQDFNGLFTEAMLQAMPGAFTPVHTYWRDDVPQDWYAGIAAGRGIDEMGVPELAPGFLDCWVGNRWDTIFDPSATRGNVRWCQYGRLLNADQVRRHFSHVPGINGLEGSTRLPSAAVFQRIARKWMSPGLGLHGSPVMVHRRYEYEKGEELLTLVCRETAPGADGRYPRGRLQLIGVPGEVDAIEGKGKGGHALLLVDQPLPAGDFSWTLFYSHFRGDDIHGKPWIEDVDQLQVDLNIAKSKHWEFLLKMFDAPIVAPGGAIGEDMADLDGYALLEVEPSLATWRPQVMQWPSEVLTGLEKEIEDLRRAIYTGGGYQSSSRGEAPGSRMAYRAIVALQQADNSVHGPVNVRFKKSACDFAQRNWRQMKTYGDVPQLMTIVGDEYAHLVGTYIDKDMLSDRPPAFKLVNAFGSSPELRAQEVLELMTTRGADGQPFLGTREARRAYPNPFIFNEAGDPKAVQRRHAKTVAKEILSNARKFRERTGFQETDPLHPWVQQAAQELFQFMEVHFQRRKDDDIAAHLATLSEITQDDTADPIARLAATMRQEPYYKVQAEMAARAAAAQQQAGGGAPGGARPRKPSGMSRTSVATDMQRGRTDEPKEEGSFQIASTAR